MTQTLVLVDGKLEGDPLASSQPRTPVFAYGRDGRMDAQGTVATGTVSAG